ncbi:MULTISPECIES: BTAD domain-containing putative transcriptional regulator [unclassified Nocardioides]|uniref:BTAD domain-containing putative transcriptional regulator n=1 Tax=unclassified Nocardioides TaxID=2615069 RepID=UPI00360C8271
MPIVRVLGPTAVTTETSDELDLGAPRHAEVLAILAAHRGRVVRAEALADLIWRGDPPRTAATTLQGYISRLRRALEPVRVSGGEATTVVTVGDGYRLDMDTDAATFEAEVLRARDLVTTRPSEAAQVLADALALWRGPALVGIADVDAIAPETQRLEELRVVARELQAQALLATGEDASVVPDLRLLVAEHPLRERGSALLALALYRCGRQADAFAVLRDLRDRLVEELGVDPGPEIVELNQRLLDQDPTLFARPARQTAASSFAGRVAELDALARSWEQACAGTVTTAVVRGEAGIGKTSLVEELVARTGADVLWGRCVADPGAPAYWPWTQVLGDLPATPTLEAGRFAFGLDVGERLRLLTREHGAIVVLDDAQWADADSLVVLDIALHALRDTPLLLVLTLRDDPPRAPDELGRVLGSLARRPRHVDLRLTGLTLEEAAPLLAGRPGAGVEAARLIDRTGGNPYFLRSLAALGDDARVPSDVRDAVRQRVAALPDGGAELVAALALAGRPVPLVVAASAAGQSLDSLERPLASALRGGLVDEPEPGHLRLAHDLVREVVGEGLAPTVRTALHTRLADAFALGGVGLAAAVAEHRLAAAAGLHDDRAARAGLDAARAALASAALEDAVTWAHRGLASAADEDLRADLHRVAGVASRRAGRLEAAEAELREEAAIARRGEDWERLAEAALESTPGGIGGYWSLFGLPLLGDATLLAEAVTHLDAVPPPLRARLLAAEATQLIGTDTAAAAALAARALDEAGADRDARARALVALVLTTWTPATAGDRLARVEELLATCAHDPGLTATATHLHRCVLLELGRVAESRRVARRFTELVDRTGDPDLALLDLWWRAGLHLLRGENDEARALASSAAETAALVTPAAATLDLISRATVDGVGAWQEGRLLDVVPDAAQLAVDAAPDFLLVVALGHAEAGHHGIALPLIDRLLAAPPVGNVRLAWTIMLASALIALREGERLEALLGELRSYGDRIIVLWPGDTSLGPAQLYLGGALAVRGERAEAREVLTAALARAEAVGARPYAERARVLLASLPD